MSMKKIAVLAAAGALVAVLALAGCASSSSSSAASASGSASASAASASASASSASAEAAAGEIKLLTEGKLIVGTSPDYPPFESLDANGNYVGLDVEIINAVAEKLGLEVQFENMVFETIIPAVSAGGKVDIGVSGFSNDPEREKDVDFTASYCIDDQAIAVMKGGEITADNADEKLAHATIAVQSGTTGAKHAAENYPEATIQEYGNSNDAFAAMQAGQADAVCTNKAVVDKMLKESYQDAEIVKQVATGEEYVMVVSKDNPALREAVNAAIEELKADGTIDRLVSEYLA